MVPKMFQIFLVRAPLLDWKSTFFANIVDDKWRAKMGKRFLMESGNDYC